MAEGFFGVIWLAGQAKPHHIHWRAIVIALKPGLLAYSGVTAVAPHTQIGTDFEFAVRRTRAYADDPPVLLEQIGCLGAHAQIECRVTPGMIGDEIEEIPLRHQDNEFAVHPQVAEVADHQAIFANLHGNLPYGRMR